MKFGIFYELQLPKPWGPDDERQLVQDALDQVELADRLGFDYAWAVEHHFLEEYSHCSASEVFLAAAAARTKRIRLGHGIRQVIPNYNHPARTAEALGMLDLVSNGRVDFGIGEGATRLELGGFNIPAKEKRAMALEAAEQIANMMVMEPYPGFEGRSFSMPVPQRHPQARAEAASADVDGLHQPRHHPGRRQPRPRRARLLLPRRGGGAHLEPDLLRHHQERRLRAARPQRQRQHRHGVGLLAATRTRPRRSAAGRRASSSSATPSTRSSPTTRCPAARGCGRSSRSSAAAARWPPPTRAPRTSPAPSRPRPASARPADVPQARALLRGRRRRPGHLPAAGRPQRARRHLRLPRAVRPRRAARVQGQGRRARGRARPRSSRPTSPRRWRARR